MVDGYRYCFAHFNLDAIDGGSQTNAPAVMTQKAVLVSTAQEAGLAPPIVQPVASESLYRLSYNVERKVTLQQATKAQMGGGGGGGGCTGVALPFL
jgi:hypothetical protein